MQLFMFAGHLHIHGLKMSKSLKNFITIKVFYTTRTANTWLSPCQCHNTHNIDRTIDNLTCFNLPTPRVLCFSAMPFSNVAWESMYFQQEFLADWSADAFRMLCIMHRWGCVLMCLCVYVWLYSYDIFKQTKATSRRLECIHLFKANSGEGRSDQIRPFWTLSIKSVMLSRFACSYILMIE